MTPSTLRTILAIGVALLLAAIALAVMDRVLAYRADSLDDDCSTLCSARSSAWRDRGAYGCVCHDGTVWRRDE